MWLTQSDLQTLKRSSGPDGFSSFTHHFSQLISLCGSSELHRLNVGSLQTDAQIAQSAQMLITKADWGNPAVNSGNSPAYIRRHCSNVGSTTNAICKEGEYFTTTVSSLLFQVGRRP